jgi:V8-like Glu-specific endopeptidase
MRYRSFLVLTLTLAGGASVGAGEREQTMAQETVFSPSLRFSGDVVEVLPSGRAIRKTAIMHGREFTWRRKLGARVAAPEVERPSRASALDIDNLSVDELAEKLRGLALFEGHEFIEAKPAYDVALAAKQGTVLGLGPSQGTASPTRHLGRAESGGLASPNPQIVHGTDNRTVQDNLIYPHRAQIVFDNTGSTTTINGAEGSGTLIAPSTAMSVAHVFWDEANDTWEADYLWAPGFDSQDADRSPWGDWFRCYWVTIPGGYPNNINDNEFDYAVLDFDVGCNSVDNGVNSDHPGSTVGWLGAYTASTDAIESTTAFVRGYPALGICGNPGVSCGVRVWGDSSSPSENDASSEEIEHQADTTGGQSGSAFYHYADPTCTGCGFGPYLVGMHRAGSTDFNLARRFDSTVLAFLMAHSGDF